MKLAASNLCWAAADDEAAWGKMKELGYTGLEIAPTRIFPGRLGCHGRYCGCGFRCGSL